MNPVAHMIRRFQSVEKPAWATKRYASGKLRRAAMQKRFEHIQKEAARARKKVKR